MSAFRVGQRVRVVAVGDKPAGFLGMQGAITKQADRIWTSAGRFRSGYLLDISTRFADVDPDPTSDGWGFFAHELEPIQYDGMQPVSWESCLWQPEGVAA
jgi:hypothetical protein